MLILQLRNVPVNRLMLTHCKLLGLLTPYQAGTLKKLSELADCQPSLFWRPKDIGAFRNSHHAKTLKQLEVQGWVEKTELSCGEFRPTYGYRISQAGIATLTVFKELSEVPLESVLGRAQDRRCAAFAKQLLRA